MRTIHKYPLDIIDRQTIAVPVGAKPLAVQLQQDQLCLWCEIDTDNKPGGMAIYIFGTGNQMPRWRAHAYIGTVQQFDGALVWHVYTEVRE